MVRHVESSETANHNTNDADLHEKETHAVAVADYYIVGDAETELVTFSKSDNEASPSTAEAVIVATAAAAEAVEEEHHHQQQHQQQQHEADVKQVEIKNESHLESYLEAAADYDAVSTSSLSQHQPGPSNRESDISQVSKYSIFF